MSSKEVKPEVSIDSVKDVVKRLKAKGMDALSHHDLAIAITTIGFKEVSKQFGAEWSDKTERQAYAKLSNSEYELGWYGRVNNPNYLPFLQMCSRGDIEKVKEFIFNLGKANRNELVNTTDNFKRTALHLAVRQGFDVLSEYLTKQGWSVNARDRQLKTALHYCKTELVCQLLLRKGANVISRDNKGCTAAHYASSGSEYKVLELMLKKANVVNQVDALAKTPLFYAVYNTSEEQVNVIRILVENGAHINDQDAAGRTPLHYAAETGKSRCIPFLLQKGASVDIRDKHGKTAIDLAASDKITKIITAYCEGRGMVFQKEEKEKRGEFVKIVSGTKLKQGTSVKPDSKQSEVKSNGQAFTKQVNQVSTWVREKFFVLMKKLQQSGIKSLWHLKRPYIYTGSWAEDVQGLQDLYECFLNLSGAEAAMRTFNILCPYEKQLPNVLGKSQEAFQSFFGQNWFSNDPVQKIRNMHSQTKIRNQLQVKMKEAEDLKTELLGSHSQIQKLQAKIMGLNQQISHYTKIEEELRKERTKNTQQYTEILKHMNEVALLKEELDKLNNGEQKTQILSNIVEELRSKNQDLIKEIQTIKLNQAAARRKCGQLFLKSLAMAKAGQSTISQQDQANLYDDDAIINMYDLLKTNPPNLSKRFKLCDRRGVNKLNIQEFTKLLEGLSMLPQDVMSMHRITGFAHGRKTLSLQQFKTILENRHKNRPMWQKQLIRKIKSIILQQGITMDTFFEVVDKDGSGCIEGSELREGLQNFNIFMNQNDWSNLFNLLDADKSGTIQLEEMKNLFQQQASGKLEEMGSVIRKDEADDDKASKKEEQQSKQSQHEDKSNKQGSELHQKDNQEYGQQDKEKVQKQLQNQDEQQKEQQQQPQKSQNKLLSEEAQQFKEEYQQEDSQAEAGIQKLNGQIKVQVPFLKVSEGSPEKVYLKFSIGDFEEIKMANLSLPKLAIALKIEMIEYKILLLSDLKLNISVFKTRDFNQENYLGQTQIEMQGTIQNPNQWAVNQRFALEASEYEKEVEGEIVLQAKWIPKEE